MANPTPATAQQPHRFGTGNHADAFVNTLTTAQKNSLRILLLSERGQKDLDLALGIYKCKAKGTI